MIDEFSQSDATDWMQDVQKAQSEPSYWIQEAQKLQSGASHWIQDAQKPQSGALYWMQDPQKAQSGPSAWLREYYFPPIRHLHGSYSCCLSQNMLIVCNRSLKEKRQ